MTRYSLEADIETTAKILKGFDDDMHESGSYDVHWHHYIPDAKIILTNLGLTKRIKQLEDRVLSLEATLPLIDVMADRLEGR